MSTVVLCDAVRDPKSTNPERCRIRAFKFRDGMNLCYRHERQEDVMRMPSATNSDTSFVMDEDDEQTIAKKTRKTKTRKNSATLSKLMKQLTTKEEKVEQSILPPSTKPKKKQTTWKIKWSSDSDIGKREYMEDYVSMCSFEEKRNPNFLNDSFHIAAVMDGHGGYKCAEYVHDNLERFVKNSLGQIKEDEEDDLDEPIFKNQSEDKVLSSAIKSLNREWNKLSIPIREPSGTTLCMLMINATRKKMYLANVGDSRALVMNPDSGQMLLVTRDHKPTDEVEIERVSQRSQKLREKTNGKQYITITQDKGDCHRIGINNRGELAMTRSIGDNSKNLKRAVDRKPDIYPILLSDDPSASYVIVLASDGLWDVLSNEDVVKSIQKVRKEKGIRWCEHAADFLVQSVLNDPKHLDNVSCVVVEVTP